MQLIKMLSIVIQDPNKKFFNKLTFFNQLKISYRQYRL